jgi:hypothetical protein
MRISTRVYAVLFAGLSASVLAAEPNTDAHMIEMSVGETIYFQLTNSVPGNKRSPVVRVQDPKRDYSVIRVTFKAGENRDELTMTVRNGYDAFVFFAINEGCHQYTGPSSAKSTETTYLKVGAPPGKETSMPIATSSMTLVMCDFAISR